MQPMYTAPRDGTYFLMYRKDLPPMVVNWPEGYALGEWYRYVCGRTKALRWSGQSISGAGIGWGPLPEDKVTGWRPIKSIPKGMDVLVGVWVKDRWSAWVASFPADDGVCPELGCDGEYGDEPTHWMPYPEGPK